MVARRNPNGDLTFNMQFGKAWGDGGADDTLLAKDFPTQPPAPKDAIVQAAGLDVLGAAIPSSAPRSRPRVTLGVRLRRGGLRAEPPGAAGSPLSAADDRRGAGRVRRWD